MNFGLTILFMASLIFPFYAPNDARRAFDFAAPETVTAVQTEKPPMFVLQIGINNYKYQKRLSGITDVLETRKLLTGAQYNVPAENILTLCDDGTMKECGGGAAVKANIIKKFNDHLIAKARAYKEKTGGQAIVVFQFSGHGSQAPDANGDEADGLDETFVTWDSRDAPGENLDISDDEIYGLTSKLSQYTDNIVYILDSCHSGSGTRGADDVRSVPARKNAVVPIREMQNETRGETPVEKKPADDGAQTDLLPPSKKYIVISAAGAGQLAQQKDVFECETCPKSKKIATLGFLTYYLLEELRAADETTSYRDVMENVRRKVAAERPSQTPQIEGADERIVFNNLNKVKNAGIRISEAGGGRFTLEAGAMQGVNVGTLVDVYSVKDEKIAVAKVVEAVADKAVAEVVETKSSAGAVTSPTREISVEKKDRAVLVAPGFGAARIKFLLGGDDAAKLSEQDKKVIETLRRNFTAPDGRPEQRGVDLAAGRWNDAGARWDIALLKDNFGKVFADKNRIAPDVDEGKSTNETTVYRDLPPADKQVFYLASKDFVPLFGFYAEAESADAAARIEEAVVHISNLRSTRAIANDKSRLKKSIVVKPFRFTLDAAAPCDKNGNIKMVGKAFAPFDAASKSYKFGIGEIFGLEITNTSDAPVYITVLDISTDGSVQILSPQRIDPEKANGVVLAARTGKKIIPEKCTDEIRATSAPSGVETFKVIATTTPTKRESFEFLEMTAIGLRGAKLSSLADWTTADIDFEISSTQTKPQ